MALPAAPTVWTAGSDATSGRLQSLTDNINFLLAPPRARLVQTVAQSIPNGAFTSVTFDTEPIDSDAGHSTVTNTSRYTCTVDGLYLVSGNYSCAANATGRRGAALALNGAQVDGSLTLAVTTATGSPGVPTPTVLIQLVAGNYVELQVYQDSGGALNTSVATPNRCALHLLRVSA
jgi:hypothetical protein